MIIDIAVAASRRTKTWKNRKMTWDELIKKLEKPIRTGETYATYVNASKEFQAEKKDVGGFVGGYLTDGKRTPATNVAHRQLITLDSDFGTTDAFDDFMFIYGCRAVSYTTHKHCPEAPRLRLIIPLDRPVSREEYEAIARKIAENTGMGYFDSTTFQPQRLMYWPSASEDGEYKCRRQDSDEILCADEVLASYVDWKDMSAWPMTDNEDITVRSDLKKQSDPSEKPGLIGAFCRAYTASEAAEKFLSDVYEPTDKDEYMTYKNGSTSAGVRVYEHGVFFYSFHNSDPTHGRLVNAFDLVRIHKFGHLDKDSDAAINKLESFKEMQSFVSELDEVKQEIALKAFDAFEEPLEDDGEEIDPEAWKKKMTLNKLGVFDSTINNIVLIINNDPLLRGKIKFNTFEGNIFIVGKLPWDDDYKKERSFVDADDAGMRHYIERVYGIFNTGKTFDAINIAAIKNSYHPIQNYILAQKWDGIPRLETLLIDYFNTEDTPYTRAVMKKTLVAAVARVFIPGIKHDTVLTLVGPQGIKKSTFFNTLGMQWFSDSFTTVQGKESFEQLQGNWIIEIAELAGFKKSEVEQIKQFVSKRFDKFRVAYGRRTENFPRQCILVGTTNESSFLKDYTGNRRFWPVTVSGFILGKTLKMEDMPVDQIWAEAKVLFDQNEPLYLDTLIEEMASAMQMAHTEAEERVGIVERFLETPITNDWNKMGIMLRRQYYRSNDDIEEFGSEERVSVCVAEIWTELFEQDFGKMTSVNTKYIHQMLAQIPDWVKSTSVRSFGPYGRQRAYVKINGLVEKPDGSKIRGEAKA